MRRPQPSSADFVLVIAMVGSLLAIACSGDSLRSPTGPNAGATVDQSTSASAPANGLPLTAVVGTGSGTFNLTHTASDRLSTGDAQFTISVHGVSPNTVLYVQRAGDIGLPGGQQADGVCQRAIAGLFGPVPHPEGGTVTLETSPGGAGATHVHFFGPTPNGTTIDTVYRLVDALPPAVPTVDLRTPCFTFTIK
jgi:hypothetical protein